MSWLTDRRLYFAAIVAWLVIAGIGLVLGPPLGHDEAAFAITARGDAPVGAWLYRSDGTVAIAQIGVWLGGADWQLRLASVGFNGLILVAVFAVGRAAYSPRTGAWAAALLAGSHWMVLRSAELLGDLPAAACILGGLAILVGELDRERGPRWRLLAAAPLFAAAFYLRYGSAPVVAFAIALACALWWRAAWARRVRMLAMIAGLALLLIPHLLHSRAATGTPFGIIEISAAMPRRAYVGEGLVTYVASNPLMFYGFLSAPVMLAGLFGLSRVRRKAPWFLALVALGQLLLLGLRSHGQPRYVYVATALLLVVGVDVVRTSWPRPRTAFALVAVAWLGCLISTVPYFQFLDDARAPVVEAARVIREHANGQPCTVVAPIVTQLIWYSGCIAFASHLLRETLPQHRRTYAASLVRWPIQLEAVLPNQHLRATPLATRDPRAKVWRLD
jgi:4-amino-4-deoxy-L-arabinose transferase-like glycosyltransferase